MSTNTRTKYRPVLTSFQIIHILELAKKEVPLSSTSISIIGTLAPFQAKIVNSGIVAAYTTSPNSANTPISLASLEATVSNSDNNDIAEANKELYWKQCYDMLIAEGIGSLSLAEIDAANEYKYINDLMSPEEQADFESEGGDK